MKKCARCGEMINDTAKFCRFCGTKIEEADNMLQNMCPHCSKPNEPDAKFCRHCGRALGVEELGSPDKENGIAVRDRYVTWHVLPGQLAVKIDEDEIASYGKPTGLQGLYVAPGTRALLFADGRYVATLDSGRYKFRDFGKNGNTKTENADIVDVFFNNLAEYIQDGVERLFSLNVKSYSVLLVKGSEFPLIFDCKNIPTKNLRNDIALHVLCKIGNLNDFYNRLMTDKSFISIEAFAETLTQSVNSVLYRMASDIRSEEIDHNAEFAGVVLAELQDVFQMVCPYVIVTNVIDIASTQKEADRIRQLKEDLYIAEQELEQAQLRNNFMNRLQNLEYDNQLREARSRVDFEALMAQVNRDGLLNKDEMDRFVMMLNAERQLRIARTETETANALDQLVQSRMLSQAEIASLKESIKHKADMAALENAQLIAMATLRNEKAREHERLNWEIEIGKQRVKSQLEIQEMQDEYAAKRAKAALAQQQEKWEVKLGVLREMDTMQSARKAREHQDKMEEIKLENENQQAILKIYAQMSEAQIMAANPNISPEAAKALAEKFKAEAAAAQNVKSEAVLNQANVNMMEILKYVLQSNNDAKERELAMKEEELKRSYASSQQEQGRFLAGVQSLASTFSGTKVNRDSGDANRVSVEKQSRFCDNCGEKIVAGSMACGACGKTL